MYSGVKFHKIFEDIIVWIRLKKEFFSFDKDVYIANVYFVPESSVIICMTHLLYFNRKLLISVLRLHILLREGISMRAQATYAKLKILKTYVEMIHLAIT